MVLQTIVRFVRASADWKHSRSEESRPSNISGSQPVQHVIGFMKMKCRCFRTHPSCKTCYAISDADNPAHDFVPRNKRQLWLGQFTVDDMEINPAYTTSFNRKENLIRSRRWIRNIFELQLLSRTTKHHSSHLASPAAVKR